MAYELFQNKAAKFGSPQATIRNGKIAFNADAGDLWDKLGSRFAHLLWDADAHTIAIRPIKNRDENTFLVSAHGGKRGRTISALSFLKYIHWTGDKPVTVDVRWNDSAELMEIVVPKERITVAMAAAPKRRKVR